MARSAPSVNSRSTPCIRISRWYCRPTALCGPINTRTSSSSPSDRNGTVTGNRPTNSGMSPYRTRSLDSVSAMASSAAILRVSAVRCSASSSPSSKLKKNGSSFAADSRARLVSMDGRWSVSVGDVDDVAASDWTASSSANRARVAPSADASDAAAAAVSETLGPTCRAAFSATRTYRLARSLGRDDGGGDVIVPRDVPRGVSATGSGRSPGVSGG
mmetsp:Transcript_11242/g.51013  ORF Transcript_11242/g.51013 Transcript_11242/m.51013 type:complete len:216 (-) Transcript_11242:702-1349(-)